MHKSIHDNKNILSRLNNMPSKDNSDGPWLFVTTSPTCHRPSKAQQSQVKRRVMREIGFSRRKKGHESRTSFKEEKNEHIIPGQVIELSSDTTNKPHEGNDHVAGSLYTSVPASLDIGLGYPTPLENNARLILSHSTFLYTT